MNFSGHREAYANCIVIGLVWERGCGCYIWKNAVTFSINKFKVSYQKITFQNLTLIIVDTLTYDNQQPDEYINNRVQYTDSIYVLK